VRPLLAVLAALVTVPAATADAAPPILAVLTASATQVRAGEVVTVQGDVCPTGLTVSSLAMQTMPAWFPKGTPPFVPLDLESVGLAQSTTGVSFRVTAAEARTSLSFQLTCSDGSSATSSAPVFVFPPYGEFWWTFNSYGEFVATPGFVFFFGMRTMDCAPGTSASASLTPPRATTPAVTATGSVADDGVVAFDIDLPADLPAGTYTGTITCTTPRGDIRNDVPVTMQGAFPASGSAAPTLVLAAAALLVLAGITLMAVGRRSPPPRGGRPPGAE
jgi:hypothetical protein